MSINEVLSDSVFFGIFITIGAYQLGMLMQKKWKLAIFNPLLLAATFVIVFLLVFHIDYETYEKGGQYISVFLTPVTVCLALPLYRQIRVLREDAAAIIVSIVCGCLSHAAVMVALGVAFGLNKDLLYSMLPKSVTTPIAVGISGEIGGIEVVTIMAVVAAGIIGAALGPVLLRLFRITEPIAQGLGMGTAAHAVGTSRTMEMGELQGAMSSLAIVVTGVLTVVFVPVLVRFL